MISDRRTRGFTFVELLVALLIIAVGVAGLVSLQRTFIQSSTRAAERTAALEIAQQQLEQLRFTEYANISSGSTTVSRDNKNYTLNWQVDPYYYADAWLTTGDTGLPDPLPAQPDSKAITIDVDWVARGGEGQSLLLEAWLSRITARDGGLVVTSPAPRPGPKVVYNPGAAPEVIAVKLTDDDSAVAYQIKETTKPTPQVERRGDKLQVTFNTVTYDEATQTQRVEDFVTVNCSCRFTGIGNEGFEPNRLILQDGRLALDPQAGEQLDNKMQGEPADGDQPVLCAQCCRDHHDNNEMVNAGLVYRQEALSDRLPSGDHRHFRYDNGQLVQAALTDVYQESCRMRRIGGYYAMYPDWQFRALTATSADYLIDSAGAAAYTDYVRDVVRALVTGGSMPAPLADRDMTVLPGAYQLIGRGIYLDDMTPDHLQAVQTAIINNEPDWLAKVPFYEVNLTLLADWSASQPAVAEVTNEPIQTLVDPINDFYGTYSRGRVNATSGGESVMTITAREGNASVLGSISIHPDEMADLTSSLTVTVDDDSNSNGTTLYSVTGEVNCLDIYQQACKQNQYKDVQVTTSNLNVTCSYSKQGSADTGNFACNGVPAGTNLDIYFSKPGFTFNPSVIQVTNLSSNETHSVLMTEN
ncbi:hypothetical protein IDSA_01375 [Pseudidiomarina salinarum]|uniref:Prepilin-type N-terminal cleavage/methylation domain-containing protein n=1 Tax=Pseudidiomarina salinarum TaxID=435908 RepID=A0A094IUQ1_9GAMM|nr:prepilin-type N-terminal cleavage/methylation domain-containing protein [Pseudidiomarina salinarum]KFZ31400.1 hypothetical protein IDSA_01375 [Pseudidiomarina salinarum]RUO70841.1 prepilin-type cleavage/methylation domain-containing protein [Pseudidiomarina salinarum]